MADVLELMRHDEVLPYISCDKTLVKTFPPVELGHGRGSDLFGAQRKAL